MASSPTLKEFREVYNPNGSLNKLIVKIRDGNGEIHELSLLETSHIEKELVKFLKDELQHKQPYETFDEEIEAEIKAARELAEAEIEARRAFILGDEVTE